jgi:hypothetical protein
MITRQDPPVLAYEFVKRGQDIRIEIETERSCLNFPMSYGSTSLITWPAKVVTPSLIQSSIGAG